MEGDVVPGAAARQQASRLVDQRHLLMECKPPAPVPAHVRLRGGTRLVSTAAGTDFLK
jgi:hypothetical protein